MRNHSGGFINEEHIWDIGSPTRGRDGDNARDAAKKYNDHRHSAILFTDAVDFAYWISESQQPVLVGPDGTVEGGIITNNPNAVIRKHGDLAYFQGILWMYDGQGVVPVGRGGVSFDTETLEVVYSRSSVEFAFNSYKVLSMGESVENASSQKLVGTVVIDYSDFSDVGLGEYAVTLDIVGSIDPSQLYASTLYSDIQNVFDEQGDLPLYVKFITTLHTMNENGRFVGRDAPLQADAILNAYSDIGDESIVKMLDFIPNTKAKYSLYIERPSTDEFLARFPQLELSGEQIIELEQIISTSEVQLSKAAIRVTTIFTGA
jgi:hypothetical protein